MNNKKKWKSMAIPSLPIAPRGSIELQGPHCLDSTNHKDHKWYAYDFFTHLDATTLYRTCEYCGAYIELITFTHNNRPIMSDKEFERLINNE